MKFKITYQRRNELLKRDELTFRLEHGGSGTPPRVEVRKKLADMLNVDVERVFVKKIETKMGSVIAVGEVNIYDSVDQAKYVEPKYIMLRNVPKSEKKE